MKKLKTNKIWVFSLVFALILSILPMDLANAATSKDVTKTFKDKKKVTSLVKCMNDWIGYQYIYNSKNYQNETITLSNKFMLNVVSPNYMSPTSKGLQAKVKAVFGKKPAMKYLSVYDDRNAFLASPDFVAKLADGSLTTRVGDWGCAYPMMTVKKIVKNSSTTYTLTVQTHMYDASEDIKELIGVTTIKIKKNKDAKYGYYVTGIKMKAK